jgi:hypothetical protein
VEIILISGESFVKSLGTVAFRHIYSYTDDTTDEDLYGVYMPYIHTHANGARGPY